MEPPARKGAQHRFHFPAQIRHHADPLGFKRAAEPFGHCAAKESFHAQLRHAPGQRLRRQHPQGHFPALDRRPAPLAHDQQPGRGVEHRGNPLLPDGNGDSHASRAGRGRASAPCRLSDAANTAQKGGQSRGATTSAPPASWPFAPATNPGRGKAPRSKQARATSSRRANGRDSPQERRKNDRTGLKRQAGFVLHHSPAVSRSTSRAALGATGCGARHTQPLDLAKERAGVHPQFAGRRGVVALVAPEGVTDEQLLHGCQRQPRRQT